MDFDALRTALVSYAAVLHAQAATRASAAELVELDRWMRAELRKEVEAREDGHLTRRELCRLMKWKLAVRLSAQEAAFAE